MKIEIAQHGRMSESGSSLLRLIQNQDMPLLDLLVREAVQNSLDAADDKPFVNVDISVTPFNAKALNKHLDGITDQINRRFPGSSYKSIIVKDSNTVGLTGPVRYEDVKGNDFGNCLKLIYEISKPQLNEGAGGSWGLGKTIYFRLGIGLVLYYSRIKYKGRYKSRLAACLVEDETKKDSLIPSSGGVKRGIAWWGTTQWNRKITVPIEDDKEIARILSVFNIKPYVKSETGTTIIIPYINETALLQEVYAKNDDIIHRPYWASSIEEYLKVAFQRWYAPRILNTTYDGAYLRPSINNKLIKISTLLPLFKVIRELYILATTGAVPEDSIISDSDISYHVDEIRTREIFLRGNSSAGKFAYLKLTDKQLMMTPPDNHKTPYQQISNRVIPMESGNTPIVMFTRKPGMVVGYDYNGAWTHRMPKSGEDEYIIGLFVANSSNRLANIYDSSNNHLLLEEYIRQGEKADHASWSDRNIGGMNPRVITKVQSNIIRTIASQYKEKPVESVERQNTGLSHALANILLPSTEFGHRSSSGSTGGGNQGGSVGRSSKPTISLDSNPEFSADSIVFRYEASIKEGDNFLRLAIITDYKKYYSDSWESEKEIGKPFPIAFTGISIEAKKENNKQKAWNPMNLVMAEGNVTKDDIMLYRIDSELFHTHSTIKITTGKSQIIKGKISIKTKDLGLKVTVDIKGV